MHPGRKMTLGGTTNDREQRWPSDETRRTQAARKTLRSAVAARPRGVSQPLLRQTRKRFLFRSLGPDKVLYIMYDC